MLASSGAVVGGTTAKMGTTRTCGVRACTMVGVSSLPAALASAARRTGQYAAVMATLVPSWAEAHDGKSGPHMDLWSPGVAADPLAAGSAGIGCKAQGCAAPRRAALHAFITATAACLAPPQLPALPRTRAASRDCGVASPMPATTAFSARQPAAAAVMHRHAVEHTGKQLTVLAQVRLSRCLVQRTCPREA